MRWHGHEGTWGHLDMQMVTHLSRISLKISIQFHETNTFDSTSFRFQSIFLNLVRTYAQWSCISTKFVKVLKLSPISKATLANRIGGTFEQQLNKPTNSYFWNSYAFRKWNRNSPLVQIREMKYSVQIVTGDSGDTTPSILFHFDSKRYLFNCGEGSQRFCMEHQFRLNKLKDVFVTKLDWSRIGGLPGK
jgi:hypothetical protein